LAPKRTVLSEMTQNNGHCHLGSPLLVPFETSVQLPISDTNLQPVLHWYCGFSLSTDDTSVWCTFV